MSAKKISPYKRKKEGRTNYKKRLILLKSQKPRLIIRRTNTSIIMQVAEYQPSGDRIVCGINSSALKKLGWNYSCNNLPACYLAGLLVGKKALAKKITEAIPDLGLQTTLPGSRLYAAIKGTIDAGLMMNASEEVFPSKERLSGEHIAKFFEANKNKTQFSGYAKQKLNPAKIKDDFEDLKKKITKG
ncbi:50S ribosomal protein L18 [Candidatus Woesearchaeota archaeon]|nr:50S ribosomal protein L18 [Candidatus Woesearchaeota archaeon]